MNDNAFITGSQVYGIPTDKSDIDVVVKMSPEDMINLCSLAGKDDVLEYGDGQTSIRFGKLNLIICYDDGPRFNNWKKGTEELKQTKPNTRDHAIFVFEELFTRES